MDALYQTALDTFADLLQRAKHSQDPEPTAMALATVDAKGCPSVRTVLLKNFDARGFVFYTNFHSHKGQQLAHNPQAALLFHWKTLRDGIQVRIEGTVEPVSAAEADAYFVSRPRASQIGAWASLQSQPLASQALFEQRVADIETRYIDLAVPRPPHWSGFRVVPECFEFWYAAPFRLHERQLFTRAETGWMQWMLYP
jgi:pyridoxamine 5'-phosphate oxidase